MTSANFQSVYDVVKEQLQQLDQNLLYHGKDHTLNDVVPAAIQLCEWEGLNEEDALIVKTAALFHDTGFLDQYDKNEPMGCDRAREELPKHGFFQEQIDKICECIMATQIPQNPKGYLLAEIMCDADLSHLGDKKKFWLRSESLRMELNLVKNLGISPRKWNVGNLDFLAKHKYWTKSANEKLKPVKEKHVEETLELLNMKDEPSDS